VSQTKFKTNLFLGASPQTPWVGFADFGGFFCEAEQRFLLLFLEKKSISLPYTIPLHVYVMSQTKFKTNLFLGASPQTPWVGFADFGVWGILLRSRATLFASFSGKRSISLKGKS
jgi:hypothetical protein